MLNLILGDCVEKMRKMDENSVDSVVTDPPYELEFMGKKWDKTGIAYNLEMWNQVFRVIKPGGFLLSFGGTRTYHRMTCAIEDAGFEIRDCIMWVYGSGFPKSLDIGKAIDKYFGAEGKPIGKGYGKSYVHLNRTNKEQGFRPSDYYEENEGEFNITEPTTPEAKQWDGWGTALKPACEPIVVARKPISEKNIALNVLKWGTGGMNIDRGRIQHNEDLSIKREGNKKLDTNKQGWGFRAVSRGNEGRFPANLILDEESARMMDEQSGESKSSGGRAYQNTNQMYSGGWKIEEGIRIDPGFGDTGGASRFFYVAKASSEERNMGLEGREKRVSNPHYGKGGFKRPTNEPHRKPTPQQNFHPTVKPIRLMEYLVRLVTPPKGVVLDPFMGTGSTGIACYKNGFKFVGIEIDPEYVEIAKARLSALPKRLEEFMS